MGYTFEMRLKAVKVYETTGGFNYLKNANLGKGEEMIKPNEKARIIKPSIKSKKIKII